MSQLTEFQVKRRFRFQYPDGESLRTEFERLGLSIAWSDDLSMLLSPLDIGSRRVPNRLVVHPMEGFDSDSDGAPGELGRRRYQRYAAGGAGLIWFEATSVVAEGRSNPHQMYLHNGSVAAFAHLVADVRRVAAAEFGAAHVPFLVLQLTHSGRWSRPWGDRKPVLVHHNSELDSAVGVDADYRVVTDDELDSLQEDFVRAARLAADAGFDAVDIKACHGYLVSELLASFTRQGRFGGSFENRSRFLKETVARVRHEVPAVAVAVRVNVFDGLPHPYGFGVDLDDAGVPNLEEPRLLLSSLSGDGVAVANISVGVPYNAPHLGRPFSWPARGAAPSPEHPLVGVNRLLGITGRLQHAVPELPLVGTGYSWLRQYFPQVASGMLSAGDVTLVGVGRLAFAYPDFARDLLERGTLDPDKCCLACSGCTELMRAGGPTGCIVRDRGIYRLPRRSSPRKD